MDKTAASNCPSGQNIWASVLAVTRGRPDYEDAVYDPALLSHRFRLPTNVRYWLLADIQVSGDLRPLSPRKQTLPAKNWIGP